MAVFNCCLIGVLPVDLLVGIKRSGARLPEYFGIVDAGRHGAVLREVTRHGQQPPPRAGDHDVARRQMLLGVIHDRPHAFRDRLILHHDVADSRIDPVAMLRLAVDLPVVRRCFAPAASGRTNRCCWEDSRACSAPGIAVPLFFSFIDE